MESPNQNSVRLLVELEPRTRAFWSSIGAALRPVEMASEADLGLWRDVFVGRRLPWRQFLQSAVLHTGVVALLWMVSVSWLRQQNLLAHPAFDRSSLVTYSPQEYLPPLDTGTPVAARQQKGDPVYAKQPILSVPREADNRTQTIVTPPDLRLTRDVPLPNIVAVGPTVPPVPLDALRAPANRLTAPETTVIAPAPELDAARNRSVQNALNSDVIAPPPEVALNHVRGVAGSAVAVVEPAPELPKTHGRVGQLNIGPSSVIAPAPQLAVAEQHSRAARGMGNMAGGGAEPVAPPPTISGALDGRPSGRLIALGIHPAAITGPVAPPAGNRRGAFSASPSGKPGASGTPEQKGPASGPQNGSSHGTNGGSGGDQARGNRSLPGGLQVSSPDAGSMSSVAGSGANADSGKADGRLVASVTPPRVSANSHAAAPVAKEKVTELDRQVFGEKRFYSMTLNMPNLNSATGSWVIRFAELKANRQEGALIAPDPMQKSDPGYPTELRRDNVQGTVTLYAVIHSDGSVGDIRVLSSPDERLDAFASSALARWKFRPATKNGTPVALEAVVKIPFQVKREF